mmetsp:Transcript_30284/g.75180  ORF Transcript_30284/g.75180 Transcript_30284/m.75180 type:complete len:101 (+) Transcript_30284:487-789(+)
MSPAWRSSPLSRTIRRCFANPSRGEVKLARAEARAAIKKAFDDYEYMYKQREKERLKEIFDVIAEVLPKSVALGRSWTTSTSSRWRCCCRRRPSGISWGR